MRVFALVPRSPLSPRRRQEFGFQAPCSGASLWRIGFLSFYECWLFPSFWVLFLGKVERDWRWCTSSPASQSTSSLTSECEWRLKTAKHFSIAIYSIINTWQMMNVYIPVPCVVNNRRYCWKLVGWTGAEKRESIWQILSHLKKNNLDPLLDTSKLHHMKINLTAVVTVFVSLANDAFAGYPGEESQMQTLEAPSEVTRSRVKHTLNVSRWFPSACSRDRRSEHCAAPTKQETWFCHNFSRNIHRKS